MAVKETLQVAAIKQAYAYLDKDPDANLPKLMEQADKLDTSGAYDSQLRQVKEALSAPANNWRRLVRSLWDDVDVGVRKKLFENFIINANGDIEPCAFIHYSDSNIKDKTLLEAFRSPLFMAYRSGQPFSENLLRPCSLLDNPGALTAIVERTGAHSTDLQSPEDVRDLSEKCREKAEKWKPAADWLWSCFRECGKCAASGQ